MRQHTLAYVSIRADEDVALRVASLPECVSIRQHTSARVSIREHTRGKERRNPRVGCLPECVSIRQHTP